MSNVILEASSDFVDLVSLGYSVEMQGDVYNYFNVHRGREKILTIMTRAGFEPEDVKSAGETHEITAQFPYVIVNQAGEDDSFATGWLNCLFRLVRNNLDRIKSQPELEGKKHEIVDAVAKEVERSIPFIPIRVDQDGALLCERPPTPDAFTYFVNHLRDSDKIGDFPGMHKYCNGYFIRRRVTKDQDALVCKSCYLRVVFPKEFQLLGQLRTWLERKIHQLR